MLESLLQASALPNMHPAVVHFPIALFPLALAFDIAGLLLRGQRWLSPAATAIHGVAAAGAWVAVWAGEKAADGLVGVPATLQPRIGEHSDWAHYALYAMLAIAGLRLVVQLRPQLTDHRGARLVLVLLGLATLGILTKASDLGGALVYEHGLAVKRPVVEPAVVTSPSPAETAAEEETASAQDRLLEAEDGTLIWRPAAGDRNALGEVLKPFSRSGGDAVRWVEGNSREGLTLEVSGPAVLLLPGTFSDVQVDLTLELLGFEGTVGLVHHLARSGDGGFLAVSSGGPANLSDLRSGQRKVLDEKTVALPAETFTLSVSSAGRHLKGFLDGKMVLHGHIAPGPAGACGLQFEGQGKLRIHEAKVIPLENH